MNKKLHHRHPLAARLTFYIVLCSSVVTFIAISLLLYRQYINDIDKLDQRIEFIRTSTLPSLRNSLWEFNDTQVQSIIDGLLQLDDVISAEAHSVTWDQQEKILVAKGSIQQQENIRSKEFIIERESRNGKKVELGRLLVTASLEGVKTDIINQAKFIIFTQLIKTFVITSIILLLIRLLLTQHLSAISKHVKSLRIEEDYEPFVLYRKAPVFPDELDNVVNALNQVHLNFLLEKDHEVKIEKQKSFLEASNKAKTEFLNHMSHEIRTPMNGVIGLLELLDGDNLTNDQKKYLKLIKQSGRSLLTIINDILDFSKMEAHKFNLIQNQFFIKELVAECASLYTASAKEKNIDVFEKFSLDFPGHVIGDSVRIKQVLLNLLSNAFKHTNAGSITISVSVTQRIDNQRMLVRFAVKDTGAGIEEHYRDQIFKAFDQGDPLTVQQGTGLGLAISKKLIDLMDGTIGVESSYGAGSEFWFTIPLIEANANHQISDSQEEIVSNFTFDHPVLVVEDNEINTQVIVGMLKKLNIKVETASNGAEAVERITLQNEEFSLVFMDCEMPVMDGFQATKLIREYEQAQEKNPLTIISLSAHHNKSHLQKCIKNGMNDHLSKPITLNDIKNLLKKLGSSQHA